MTGTMIGTPQSSGAALADAGPPPAGAAGGKRLDIGRERATARRLVAAAGIGHAATADRGGGATIHRRPGAICPAPSREKTR